LPKTDTKREKIPSWESQLWSYISSSDGEHCPLYDSCIAKYKGNLCPCNYAGYLKGLLATKQFHPADYDFIKRMRYEILFQLVERLANKYLKKGNVEQPPVPTELI
jgi:hypothetical protein